VIEVAFAVKMDGESLPEWVAFNATSQVISIDIAGNFTLIGEYEFEITASVDQPVTLENTISFTLTVPDPNLPSV